jgi:hypothetical protein
MDGYHQRIMRTTIDIDDPILRDLKKIQRAEGKSLGRLVSDLLARALGERRPGADRAKPVRWISKSMGARVDFSDREALYAAMEQEPQPAERAGNE